MKRLSQTSGQGLGEFKYEVVMVAKLQYRNLVRLLGFFLGGEEKYLFTNLCPTKALTTFYMVRPL